MVICLIIIKIDFLKVDQNDDCIDDVQCKEPFKCVRSKCKCDDDQIYHNYECLNIGNY